MRRGPGRIERAIRQLFDANSDRAFVTNELVEHCYPDGVYIEKKHTVAVLRAVHKLCARDPNWTAIPISTLNLNSDPHLGLCFCNMDSVESYARALVFCHGGERGVPDHDGIGRRLDRDDYRKLTTPGGSWWRGVEMHRAKRDGDRERLAKLEAEEQADLAALGIAMNPASGPQTR